MDKDVANFVVDPIPNQILPQLEQQDAENDAQLNPGGQQTLLIDFDDMQNNEVIRFAPGEGQKPKSLILDANAEALSYPSIYGGVPRKMKLDNISKTDIAKSDARNRDRRCAAPNKLLYSFKLSQAFQISSQISLCLRKKKGPGKATAGNLLNEEFVENLCNHDDGYKLLKNIRSSPAYWQDKQKTLMAMIRQLGIPTLFITLSAAEMKWPELIVILKQVLDGVLISEADAEDMTWESKADLIRKDPITCSRYFDYRLRQCTKYILLNKEGIFKDHPIMDSFSRIEFQHRGSPHMHGLFWLKDSPKFDEHDPDSFGRCAGFIDKYISCEAEVDGVIHQGHKHTNCCERKFKGSTKCRFGMPYPPMPSTRILLPFHSDFCPSLKIKAASDLTSIKENVEHLWTEKVLMSALTIF